MELDFSTLENIERPKKEEETEKTPPPDLALEPLEKLLNSKPCTAKTNTPQSPAGSPQSEESLKGIKGLAHKRKVEQEATAKSIELARKHQEIQEQSREAKFNLFAGIREGEPLPILFLKACDIIAKLTGDALFYDHIKGDLFTIYGNGLTDKSVLNCNLEEAQARLQMLTNAEARETDERAKNRLKQAIEKHQLIVNELLKSITKAHA